MSFGAKDVLDGNRYTIQSRKRLALFAALIGLIRRKSCRFGQDIAENVVLGVALGDPLEVAIGRLTTCQATLFELFGEQLCTIEGNGHEFWISRELSTSTR